MDPLVVHMTQVAEGMTLLDHDEVLGIVRRLELIRQSGATVYLFGNGGSAATASHFTNDLLKMCRVRAVCISDALPVTYAYGNDTGWEFMFSGPLAKLWKRGDGAIGISCSGKSPNVVNALEWAAMRDGLVIGMTGMENSSPINLVQEIALLHARVPDIRVQEDLHMIACHAIVRTMQERE